MFALALKNCLPRCRTIKWMRERKMFWNLGIVSSVCLFYSNHRTFYKIHSYPTHSYPTERRAKNYSNILETRQRLHHQGFDKYKRIKHKIQLIKRIEEHANTFFPSSALARLLTKHSSRCQSVFYATSSAVTDSMETEPPHNLVEFVSIASNWIVIGIVLASLNPL